MKINIQENDILTYSMGVGNINRLILSYFDVASHEFDMKPHYCRICMKRRNIIQEMLSSSDDYIVAYIELNHHLQYL